MRKSKVELIFDKWKAELVGKDRSRAAVAGNFDELFGNWHKSKVSFDDAYTLLDTAIRAHYPTDSIAKNTYRALKKKVNIPKNESEFTLEWRQNISATAKQMFYSIYDIDGTANSGGEVNYGSMSAQEYRKQRKYANSHPLLDWENIKIEPLDEDIDLGDL